MEAANAERARWAAKSKALAAAQASASSRFRSLAAADEAVTQLQAALRERGDEALRHAAAAAAYEKRCGELEAALRRSREAERASELRRVRDVEGFTSDFTTLRKQLAAAERRLLATRLAARLDDDERLDALLGRLHRRAPTPPREYSDSPEARGGGGAAGQRRAPAKAAGRAEEELGGVKRGLAAAGERLAAATAAAAGLPRRRPLSSSAATRCA